MKSTGPFYLLCYVDDDICVARGRGGGLAMWYALLWFVIQERKKDEKKSLCREASQPCFEGMVDGRPWIDQRCPSPGLSSTLRSCVTTVMRTAL